MISTEKIALLCMLSLFLKPITSRQSYDMTGCSAGEQLPGSNYLCNSDKLSCHTFLVYRVQNDNQSLSVIASLFNTRLDKLRSYNNISKADSNKLHRGQEIIISIECSCSGRFSQANVSYNASKTDTLYKVACETYEGLVKVPVLKETNPDFKANVSSVQVPIRCACPDKSERGNGTNFLVTYPVLGGDQIDFIARKFGIPKQDILYANGLDTFSAIFPQTILLVPTSDMPALNTNGTSVPHDPPPPPPPTTVNLDILPEKESTHKTLVVVLGGGLSTIFILMVLVCGISIYIKRSRHPLKFQELSTTNLQLSNFSPDLRDGMSKLKHSLTNFSKEELDIATKGFSQASAIGTSVFRGRIGDSFLAIEEMSSEEEAQNVVSILTKVNHLSVVKIVGCCYGIRSYILYEFAENGSLRECLSDMKIGKQLKWEMRMQIAFDLAVGLHYIHYCIKPAYVHRNINSNNVLITKDWRAKIGGFRLAKPMVYDKKFEETSWNESVQVGKKGYLPPEYLACGKASAKIDVYAFGMVLLELLSAKEVTGDGDNSLKDSTSFLGQGALEDSSGCLEKMKRFMDPALGGDYVLGNAICLALLARGCLEDDPLHRPTMNDVLKAISTIL